MSSPPAQSSPTKGDDEVVSQRTFPDRGEIPEIIRVAPQDDSSAVGHMGKKAPMGTGDGGQVPFGPQPNAAPETQVVPDSGRQPLSKEGEPPVPMTSVHLEAPDRLLEALQGASIVEEHRTLMSPLIEKV